MTISFPRQRPPYIIIFEQHGEVYANFFAIKHFGRMHIAQFSASKLVQPSESKKHMNYLIDKKGIVCYNK